MKSSIRNIYFAYKDNNTTVDYRILVNIEEKDKSKLYKEAEDQGFKIVKVLANET